MSHDLIAELAGFRTELENYERFSRGGPDRVKAVKAEIARVSKQIGVEVEKLLARAANHEEAGQDVLAAQCRVEAKRLARESRLGAPEDAADATPRETAVPPKSKKTGGA